MKKKNGEVKMVLDPRTKKYLKIFAVIALVFIFTGCTSNVDKNGHLLASRAINESTPWSLKAGFFDFYSYNSYRKGNPINHFMDR